MRRLRPVLAVLCTVLSVGCASSRSESIYSRDQARQEMTVRYGVVESVRPVTIEGTQSGVGAVAGGVVGGVVAGNTIGRGVGSTVSAVVGAVVGGIAGSAAEKELTGKAGLEIAVRLDSGQVIAVVQEADESFAPGERVRVLSGGGATRVAR